MSRAKDPTQYAIFINHFASALVSVQQWHARRQLESFENIVTTNDEAFLLTVVDGNYERWSHGYYDDNNSEADSNVSCMLL